MDSYLGMSIKLSNDGHLISVNQTGSINEFINSNLTDIARSKTPHTEDMF
jgi:hypothetical protein